VSLALANTAKKASARTRAEWLTSLSMGVISISDLIEAATTEDNRALRRITLRQLLSTQEGWGRAKTSRVLFLTTHLLGLEPTSRLTVAWLLDARAGGRRVRALADALFDRAQPWIGFPYAPLPAGGGN
jgi:hypothetical protein